jgi:hypothetical protein
VQPGHFDQIFVPDALDSSMDFLARGLVLFGLSLLATSVFAQSEPDAAILKVNGQEVFQSDLELVKSMLPLERYKTTKARTNLIESVYVEFLIEKTLLEQQGLQKVTKTEITNFQKATEAEQNQAEIRALGYQNLEGYFAKTLLKNRIYVKMSETYLNSSAQGYKPEVTTTDPNRPVTPAEKEQAITESLKRFLMPLEVSLQAMLLEDMTQVKLVQEKLKQGRDFTDLTDSYSLVHHYGGDPSDAIAVADLEPELQIAISDVKKPGLYVIKAPFDRYWLVDVLRFPAESLRTQIERSGTIVSYGYTSPTIDYLLDTPTRLKARVEILNQKVKLINPLVLRVKDIEIYLSEYFTKALLLNDVSAFEPTLQKFPDYLKELISSLVPYFGLPYQGAGTESGLENYIAARFTPSENQLKQYYLEHQSEYTFEEQEFRMGCIFDSRNSAEYWRNLFILNPQRRWINDLRSSRFYDCRIDDEIELPLPVQPSKKSLTPVPGGFITTIGKYSNKFYFLVLYNFQPNPSFKPFSLVRGQVEYGYRLSVARQRMPEFWLRLVQSVGVQDRWQDVLKELENAGK